MRLICRTNVTTEKRTLVWEILLKYDQCVCVCVCECLCVCVHTHGMAENVCQESWVNSSLHFSKCFDVSRLTLTVCFQR